MQTKLPLKLHTNINVHQMYSNYIRRKLYFIKEHWYKISFNSKQHLSKTKKINTFHFFKHKKICLLYKTKLIAFPLKKKCDCHKQMHVVISISSRVLAACFLHELDIPNEAIHLQHVQLCCLSILRTDEGYG